jgi:hypothetical protein
MSSVMIRSLSRRELMPLPGQPRRRQVEMQPSRERGAAVAAAVVVAVAEEAHSPSAVETRRPQGFHPQLQPVAREEPVAVAETAAMDPVVAVPPARVDSVVTAVMPPRQPAREERPRRPGGMPVTVDTAVMVATAEEGGQRVQAVEVGQGVWARLVAIHRAPPTTVTTGIRAAPVRRAPRSKQ